jgi:hypothetical protein
MRIEDCVGRHVACNQCGRPSLVTPVDPQGGRDPSLPPAILTAHLWYRRECPWCGVKLFQKGSVVTPVEPAGAP